VFVFWGVFFLLIVVFFFNFFSERQAFSKTVVEYPIQNHWKEFLALVKVPKNWTPLNPLQMGWTKMIKAAFF
tara:strand:- start:84 stop:299 length:216 start_codon:yes stop_codon:yes gene_type:complete